VSPQRLDEHALAGSSGAVAASGAFQTLVGREELGRRADAHGGRARCGRDGRRATALRRGATRAGAAGAWRAGAGLDPQAAQARARHGHRVLGHEAAGTVVLLRPTVMRARPWSADSSMRTWAAPWPGTSGGVGGRRSNAA
jgi:hypothetical protein